MAEFLYGMAAIKVRETYTAYPDVNKEYVLGRVKELEGVTLTWEQFEKRWEDAKDAELDELDEGDLFALMELYGERAVEVEILSDTAEEDERQILAWLRRLLVEEKWCGVADWDDAPLPWNRAGLALDRLVKQGRLIKDDGVYRIPPDHKIALRGVLCDGCEDDFHWFGDIKAHHECLLALIAALQEAANKGE